MLGGPVKARALLQRSMKAKGGRIWRCVCRSCVCVCVCVEPAKIVVVVGEQSGMAEKDFFSVVPPFSVLEPP